MRERKLSLESYVEYMHSVGEAEMLATTNDLNRRNEILAAAISAGHECAYMVRLLLLPRWQSSREKIGVVVKYRKRRNVLQIS